MPVSTQRQIRNQVLSTTKQDATQSGTIVDDFINLTLQEIANPGWAFPNKERHHLWSFLRRKTTFTTVSGTSDYVMERDVDKIAILRQLNTPIRLKQIPEDIFLRKVPEPNESGNPTFYREWSIDGVSTQLATAGKIDLLSSSANDGSSFTASVLGYISGRLLAETYTLNGTSAVAGTNTFDAREIFVSKSGVTAGNVTFRRNSDSSTLVVLGPEEISPRFKVITLYPSPNSAMTMYLEYYKPMRDLVNASDVPEFHYKWHYVVRLGALAKVYQLLGKTSDFLTTQQLFASAVRAMVANDSTNPDIIEYMEPEGRGIYIDRVGLDRVIS